VRLRRSSRPQGHKVRLTAIFSKPISNKTRSAENVL
jgi:hypothetical protein